VGRGRRRRLGQCFLVDRRVVERIAGLLDEEPPRVLEIGPGRGILTDALTGRFSRVLALEIDERLVPGLDRRFEGQGVELRLADALTEPLDPLLASEAPWQVAANLPYSVGTPILRRLWRRHDLFARLVVMLQREVAQRIVARPGEKHHGLLALERAAWLGHARMAFDVSPGSFRPRPKVVSTVLVLEPRAPAYGPRDWTPVPGRRRCRWKAGSPWRRRSREPPPVWGFPAIPPPIPVGRAVCRRGGRCAAGIGVVGNRGDTMSVEPTFTSVVAGRDDGADRRPRG